MSDPYVALNVFLGVAPNPIVVVPAFALCRNAAGSHLQKAESPKAPMSLVSLCPEANVNLHAEWVPG